MESQMAPRVFRFNDEDSFNSSRSAQFAGLVMQAATSIRDMLTKSFGLSLNLKSADIRIVHDGRRIGAGAFRVHGEQVNFVISPKLAQQDFALIFDALASHTEELRTHFHLVSPAESVPAVGEQDLFTPFFLHALLHEIVEASVHLFNISLKTNTVIARGGVRGRPLLQKSATNMITGRGWGLFCEVRDPAGLRDYAVVLLETAKSIERRLSDWAEIWPQSDLAYHSKKQFVLTHLQSLSHARFTRALLYKVCRPPFPYGLREILYKCLRYWEWQGRFKASETDASGFDYTSVVIFLDKIFEIYVREVWRHSLRSGVVLRSQYNFPYTVELCNEDVAVHSSTGSIKPDHIFWDQLNKTLLIVDAKYSREVGAEEHLYQMLSYLSYDYPDYQTDRRCGVLVYPGTNWKVEQLVGFSQKIYCIQIPIQSELYMEEVDRFVTKAFEAIAKA